MRDQIPTVQYSELVTHALHACASLGTKVQARLLSILGAFRTSSKKHLSDINFSIIPTVPSHPICALSNSHGTHVGLASVSLPRSTSK